MSNGVYTGYPDLIAFYSRKRKECPKGVTLKLHDNRLLFLQFIDPTTGKRTSRSCSVQFTEKGILEAIDKAWKVSEALKRFSTSSEFWDWYDVEILSKNKIENDLKTYRQIFEEIESEYWNGVHKNTGEKRDKNNLSNIKSFKRYYGLIFNKFTNWDNYPNWEEIKSVLFSWEQGTGQFENTYGVIKNIANKCDRVTGKKMIEKLEAINPKQIIFKDRQSISINEFIDWYKETYNSIESIDRDDFKQSKQSWLWVSAMCVLYGLRPSEVMSAINLYKPVTEKEIKQVWGNKGKTLSNSKVIIKAINDPSNTDLLLVLGNHYYVGKNNEIPITIKTGGRICTPLCNDNSIIELFKIQHPILPSYIPDKDTKPEYIPSGISRQFRERLLSYKCPVTQAYAFRHLGNQLGEKYGIPQEIRARSLGHSVAMNDSAYKARINLQTTVDLLTNYSKLPLDLDTAKTRLSTLGLDVNDPVIINVLKIIYQLDDIA